MQRLGRYVTFVMQGFNFLIHERFDLEGAHVATDHETKIVGGELQDGLVFHDQWIFHEYFGAFGFFDVTFNRHKAVSARFIKQHIQQAHQLHVKLFAVGTAPEHLRNGLKQGANGFAIIGCYVGTHGRTADQEKLEWLVQRPKMPAQRVKASENRNENNDKTKQN